jgi:hypothetical protein
MPIRMLMRLAALAVLVSKTNTAHPSSERGTAPLDQPIGGPRKGVRRGHEYWKVNGTSDVRLRGVNDVGVAALL